MKTWVRKSLKVGILSAGFLLVGGAAAAQAASTSDNFGVGSGNQVQADVVAPITVTGNSVGLLGAASAHGSSGATASAAVSGGGTGTTSHNFGILGGNQLGLAALLPINVSGNAVGVAGTAQASGGSATNASVTGASMGAGSTSGNFGVVGGNQIAPVIAIPIDVTGNAIGAFGAAQATGHAGGSGAMVTPHATGGGTSGNFGIGDGNQILPIIAIPIDICGNSVGALGTGVASCGGNGSGTGNGGNGGYGTGTGNGGYGTGTGTGTGNGGYGTGTGTGTGTGGYGTGTGGYQTGTGTGAGGGVAGASLMTAPKHLHLHKAAKAARAHAHATATRSADPADESARTRHMHASASTGLGTSGNFGILGGNQATAVISIPISITDNAIALLGSAGL